MTKSSLSNKEFRDRVLLLQKKMNAYGIDIIITYGHNSEPQYVRYFSDYRMLFETAGVAIPPYGKATLLAGPESYERACKYDVLGSVERMNAFRESSAPAYMDNSFFTFNDLFFEIAKSTEIRKVGIAGLNIIPYAIYDEIENALKTIAPSAEIVSADKVVDSIRAIKSPGEIMCLFESAKITKKSFEYVLENIREGMTCDEVKGLAISKMYEEGAEGEGFPSWVTCGSDTEYAISPPSKKQIMKGDLVQIQLGASYEGYASALGRAVVIGEPNSNQMFLLKCCIDSKIATERALMSGFGKPANLVAYAHRDELIRQEALDMLMYGPCHSIGLVECEYPWIEIESDYDLQEGMVFCTDIFLSDKKNHIGARYEDMVLIKKNGIEHITNYPNEIIVL